MNYKPHILGPARDVDEVDINRRKRYEEIRHRAIADVRRGFPEIRDSLQRLVRSVQETHGDTGGEAGEEGR